MYAEPGKGAIHGAKDLRHGDVYLRLWSTIMGHREYGLLAPGMTERLRVTTDPEYFEEHAESLELWSPGNPLFTPPEVHNANGRTASQ